MTASKVGRVSQVDQKTYARLQAGCNFINGEVGKLRMRVLLVGVFAFLAALFFLLKFRDVDLRVPFAIAFVPTSLVYGHARKQLKDLYKNIVVKRIVSAIGTELVYSPFSSFTEAQFNAMDLFNKRAEDLNSEDQVTGHTEVVPFWVHEVKATREEGSGRNRRTVVIFKGLIAELDFNKNFQGHTVIVPESEAQILLGLFGESESRGQKEIVRLENPEFTKKCAVYSTNDQEARYIITPKLMELILRAQIVLDAPLRLCFLNKSLFVVVPQSRDNFEVAMFGSAVTPENAAGDLAYIIDLAGKLVLTLDLETRIWSKV